MKFLTEHEYDEKTDILEVLFPSDNIIEVDCSLSDFNEDMNDDLFFKNLK